MRIVPTLLIFIVYIAVILMSGTGKKEKKKEEPAVPAAPQVNQAKKAQKKRVPVQSRKDADKKDDPFAARQLAFAEGEDPCHPDGRAAFQKMGEGDGHEGEDPCHPGETADASPVSNSPIYNEESAQAMQRAVLEGIVMSEILTRPKDRRRAGR